MTGTNSYKLSEFLTAKPDKLPKVSIHFIHLEAKLIS